MTPLYLVWFRQDLRVADNPALHAAVSRGNVFPLYIKDPTLGAASQSWLSKTLPHLKLKTFEGDPQKIILDLVQQLKPAGVYWNRCYEPIRIEQDAQIKAALVAQNLDCQSFNASLLFEPWEILKKDQTPYKVFTPYYHKCLEAPAPRKPLPVPKNHILSQGEQAAQKRLHDFLEQDSDTYSKDRDFPALDGTSKLSPYLHFGEISPNQIWWSVSSRNSPFLRQLIWREFSYHLLFHFPDFSWKNYQSKFDEFPWTDNPTWLKAWQDGQTGYPIIDAGMRELQQTGNMHNRVRMLVGSFLTKNLLIHWHHGAQWFWEHLSDADLANNSMGWQWIAGCGVDAAPFFRIFNPVTQGEKFDPHGAYTRQFVPELKDIPDAYLFKPWEAPNPPRNYPKPIVDLKDSRQKALLCYKQMA